MPLVIRSLLALLLTLAGCMPESNEGLPSATVLLAGRTAHVAIASTRRQHELGLMHVARIPPDHGMLFVFADDAPRAFWMKNTLLPLSVAFLDRHGLILNIEDMEPRDDAPRYRSAGPARYALEMERGWFRRNGVLPGMQVELPQQLRPTGGP